MDKTSLTPQEKLRYIYRFLPFGITRVDQYGRFLYWGEHIKQLLGYSAQEMVGKRYLHELFIQPQFMQSMLHDVVKNGETTAKMYLRRKDGTEVYVLMGLFWEQPVDGDPTIAVLTIDLAQEASLKQELAQKDQSLKLTFEELLSSYKYIGSINRQLAMLISTINTAHSAKSQQEALNVIADLLQKICESDIAFIRVCEADTLCLRAYVGPSSNRPKKYLNSEDSLFKRLNLGEKLFIIPDITADEKYRSYGLPENDIYKSMLLYPLWSGNERHGQLVAYSAKRNKFVAIDKHVIEILAGITSMVLRLYR